MLEEKLCVVCEEVHYNFSWRGYQKNKSSRTPEGKHYIFNKKIGLD